MHHHPHKYNPAYIHHNNNSFSENIREIVFGAQDGMVSTLGAITGIAVGSQSHFAVILAGIAIISVESVSMAIGSYISTLSERRMMERILHEEREEINDYPKEEELELEELYIKDGWPEALAKEMARTAAQDEHLMLKEMAYRELNISPESMEHPLKNGVFMFFSYIVGGLIPLSSYFFLPLGVAIAVSTGVTLLGLFALGAGVSHFTKQRWFTAGARTFVFGGVALLVGYLVGVLVPMVGM